LLKRNILFRKKSNKETLSPQAPQTENPEDTKPAFLCFSNYGVESDLLVGALEEQGIPTQVKHIGVGQVLSLYFGRSYQGVDIYVPSCLLEKARLIIEELKSTENVEE